MRIVDLDDTQDFRLPELLNANGAHRGSIQTAGYGLRATGYS